MIKTVVKTVKWIGLVSGAGLIAISASTFASTSAMAAAPVTPYGQVSPDLQQQQQKDQLKKQKSGQLQYQQGGQQQNGQQWNQQNGQAQYQQGSQWQSGQPWNQQNGQLQYKQGGQWQNGQQWNQQNGQWQNGQAQYQQGGQWQNDQWQQNQQRHPYDWTAYRPGHRPAQWQQYQQDFNPRAYEINRDSERRYHWQHYAQPRGWYYQRWVYGQILPIAFWGREYWLDGYSSFGLIDPPYGYVWVRYGNDALLVNVENGQILSVEYGLFYT